MKRRAALVTALIFTLVVMVLPSAAYAVLTICCSPEHSPAKQGCCCETNCPCVTADQVPMPPSENQLLPGSFGSEGLVLQELAITFPVVVEALALSWPPVRSQPIHGPPREDRGRSPPSCALN